MEQLIFNRDDWSGEEMTLQVNRDTLEWEQYGYKFKLEAVENDFYDEELGISMRILKCTGDDWDQPLFSLTKFSNDPLWHAVDGDVTREHEDPIVCAATMICNVV